MEGDGFFCRSSSQLSVQKPGFAHIDEAIREWGPSTITSYGSNSRVSALKARKMLGWAPKGRTLLDDIEAGSYAEALWSRENYRRSHIAVPALDGLADHRVP